MVQSTAWSAKSNGVIDLTALARAAIEAMREPMFEMVETGQEVNNLLEEPDPPNAFKFLSRDEMTEAWQAMIDAALSERDLP